MITQIPTSQIQPGNNDRQTFNRVKLQELADSIKANGLAQPITVRPHKGHYEVVAGERRLRAISELLGWSEAPCIVREMTDEEAAAIMLAENTGRVDLNPIEEARAYQARIAAYHWSIEDVATNAGVSVQMVKNRLSLLKLADDIQHLVANGHFPIGHAQLMSSLDHNRQRIALRVYREKALAFDAFKPVVSKLLEEQQQESLFNLDCLTLSTPDDLLPAQTKTITITHRPGESVDEALTRYATELAKNGMNKEAGRVMGFIKPSIWPKITQLFSRKDTQLCHI